MNELCYTWYNPADGGCINDATTYFKNASGLVVAYCDYCSIKVNRADNEEITEQEYDDIMSLKRLHDA